MSLYPLKSARNHNRRPDWFTFQFFDDNRNLTYKCGRNVLSFYTS